MITEIPTLYDTDLLYIILSTVFTSNIIANWRRYKNEKGKLKFIKIEDFICRIFCYAFGEVIESLNNLLNAEF